MFKQLVQNIREARGETKNLPLAKRFQLKRISPFIFRTWKLQAITILYIGGASGTSSLLTCQELDGNHDASATFRCNLMFFFRFWALFALRVLSFLFLVRVLLPKSA